MSDNAAIPFDIRPAGSLVGDEGRLGKRGGGGRRWAIGGAYRVCLPLFLALLIACELRGQVPGPGAPLDPGRPLGQPPTWTLSGGLSLSTDPAMEDPGFEASASLRTDLVNPVTGLLGLRLEAQLLSRSGGARPGVRVLLDAPAFMLHWGVRWDLEEGAGPVLGMTLPPRRGGWPVAGAMLEFGWQREAGDRLSMGLHAPVGSPSAGRTRPRSMGPWRAPTTAPPPGPIADGDAEVLRSMHWIATFHNLYWFTDRTGIGARERVLRSRQILEMLDLEIGRREVERGGRPGLPGELDHYHAALVAWFARALAPATAPATGLAPALGVDPGAVTEAARRVMLESVVLPWNATVGRPSREHVLPDLLAGAEPPFDRALDAFEPGLDPGARARALEVFRGWGAAIEDVRRELGRWTGDTRVDWLPLALVLHPSEHDTPAKVDDLLERAVGRAFTRGNEVDYFDGNRFQAELVRTIREARSWHLLWVHDFRSRRDDGDPDRAGFEVVTEGYLPALIDAVRRHDEGEPFPTFVLLFDQYYYEVNRGRAWMDLLENPMGAAVRLPRRPSAMEARVAELQAELRSVVGASERLAAEAELRGPGWIERVVRVQVNVTHPSDFSFRSKALLSFPVGADNLMRDHRKIIARDLDPGAPWQGEVIVTGMGVGDHYAEPGWDDRSLLVRGPGALPVIDEARAVLEAHGVPVEAIPEVLRAGPWGPGLTGTALADASPASGPDARVLQLHNRVGWEVKEASFVQKLLYDLLPPGTVIYVPDSLWTSPEWMAQLVSAALRGCEVMVVAPALVHAPQPGFPSMSETRELLTALLVVEGTLDRVIRQAGGRIRVGVYARSSSTRDGAGRVTELRTAHHRAGGAGDFLDLPVHQVGLGGQVAEPVPAPGPNLEPRNNRRPLLHGKTQLYASRAFLERLAGAPGLPAVLEALEAGRIPEDVAARQVAALAAELGDPELHLLVGSLNRNVRSMALDGEVVVVVSGVGAAVGLLDFVLLGGAVRWLGAPEELDPLIPPMPDWKRLLGRWLLRII